MDLNKYLWLTCAASLGLGAFVVIGIRPGKPSPNVVTTSIPGAQSSRESLPATQPLPQSDNVPSPSAASAPLPPVDRPLRWDPQLSTESHLEAIRYTQTLQPGVVTEDSVPYFVTLSEDSVGGSAVATLFNDHKVIPEDGWSVAMGYRLGQYFEAQPEITVTRVSVSCRPSRCLLQLMALPQTEHAASNSMAMVSRLKLEPWYSEEFLDSGRIRPMRVATRGDAARYMALILNRRPVVDMSRNHQLEIP